MPDAFDEIHIRIEKLRNRALFFLGMSVPFAAMGVILLWLESFPLSTVSFLITITCIVLAQFATRKRQFILNNIAKFGYGDLVKKNLH